jgi:hypothetical protein
MTFEIGGCVSKSFVLDKDEVMIFVSELKPGDSVKGVFGKTNTVKEVIKSQLGANRIITINNSLTCLEKTIFFNSVGNPVSYSPIPHILPCMSCSREPIQIPNYGNENTNPHFEFTNMKTFVAGDSLYFLNNFNKAITHISYPIDQHPLQEIYTILLDGDHTCFLNGYAMIAKQNQSDPL